MCVCVRDLFDGQAAMDDEVSQAKLRYGFVAVPTEVAEDGTEQEAVGERSEADDDYNFMASMIESVGSQFGTSGPVTNMFGDMSVSVPAAWKQASANTDTKQ